MTAQDLQDAFEFGVAEEGYLQGAFALGVTQMDFGAQALAQLVLQVGDVGIPGQRRNGTGLGGGAGFAGLQVRDQRLGLADVEAFLEDALGGEPLLLSRRPGPE